jgi:hypothetical protein
VINFLKTADSQKLWAQRIQQQRKKKEQERFERFQEEELQRQEVDRQEELYQQSLKDTQLRISNQQIFENQEKYQKIVTPKGPPNEIETAHGGSRAGKRTATGHHQTHLIDTNK